MSRPGPGGQPAPQYSYTTAEAELKNRPLYGPRRRPALVYDSGQSCLRGH